MARVGRQNESPAPPPPIQNRRDDVTRAETTQAETRGDGRASNQTSPPEVGDAGEGDQRPDSRPDGETLAFTGGPDIERAAYDLYCERGRVDGHDQDDWFEAERRVRAKGAGSANDDIGDAS